MVKPLSLYPNTATSSIAGTARVLLANPNVIVGSSAQTELADAATGFGEFWSQGNAGAWAAGALNLNIAPTGHGWFLDSNYLDGNTIPAGLWTAQARGATSANTATVDLYYRLFIYNIATGVYTSVGVLPALGNAYTTAATSFAFAAQTLPQIVLTPGNRLYVDLWGNITATTMVSTNTISVVVSNQPNSGVSTVFLTAPGYDFSPGDPIWHRPRWILRPFGTLFTPFQAIPAWVDRAFGSNFVRATSPVNIPHYVRRGLSSLLLNYGLNISTRFRLGLVRDISTRFILGAGGLKDIQTRFRLGLLKDISTRFRLSQQSLRDITTRLRLRSADQLKDVATRFRLRSANQLKDVTTRFRLAQQSVRDITTRFRLKSADQLKDVATRFRLAQSSVRDIQTRFRIRSANQLRDIATRFRLMSASQLRDIAARLRLGLVRDITTRLRLGSLRDISTRFILATANQSIRDIATRFRIRSADQLRDVQTRFKLVQQRIDDIATRFRLRSANQLKDLATRLRLGLVRDVASRLRLGLVRDVASRLRLKSADQLRDVSTRFKLTSIGQSLRDISTRLRLRSANLLKDIASRFRLGLCRDIACRFNLQSAAGSSVFKFQSSVLSLLLATEKVSSAISTGRPSSNFSVYEPRSLSGTLVGSMRSLASSFLTLIGVSKASLPTTSIRRQSLSFMHGAQVMPAPFTTILSTITVTDVNAVLVSNLSVVTLTVTFPDQTTTTVTLAGGGVSNLGSGQYQAKYNTKMAGPTREVWSVTAADGTTIGSYQSEIGVGY